MKRPYVATLLIMLCPFAAAAAQEANHALSVAREVERQAADRSFWPGFNPLTIPLAVFTGRETYLFRHPSPPDGFRPYSEATPRVFVLTGRHPAVTSNSSAEIGGIMTATLLADGERARLSTTDLAATAVHEAFHVFQRARHARWSGNEGSIFTYPTDDARILTLRRLESAALRRALGTATAKGAACWTRAMLQHRRYRFEVMDSAFSTYERLTELNEGLATYIQLLAAGKRTVTIPINEFKPGEFRERIYATGPALAFLLDRMRPGWQRMLEANDSLHLDQLLESTLVSDSTPCVLPAEETADIETRVRQDMEEVHTRRRARRAELDSLSGWRVVIHAAEGQPLWPQGFDPLNVEPIEGGFLHSRFLRLGNDAGTLQAIDEGGADLETMTEGVGPHPLFNGVRRVIIAGLSKPETKAEDKRVDVRAHGFAAEFSNATLEVQGTTVIIHLAPRR